MEEKWFSPTTNGNITPDNVLEVVSDILADRCITYAIDEYEKTHKLPVGLKKGIRRLRLDGKMLPQELSDFLKVFVKIEPLKEINYAKTNSPEI